MPEPQRNTHSDPHSDMTLEGFEQIFEGVAQNTVADTTVYGEPQWTIQLEKLLERLTDLISLSIDQRNENARMSAQLIDNQRQLIATQQILIRLMEKSIDLTRHISSIEEKLPAIFELPRLIECLKDRIVKIEGVEID